MGAICRLRHSTVCVEKLYSIITAGYSDLLVDIGNSGVMFVPQEPYLISGTLAEQVNMIKNHSDYPRDKILPNFSLAKNCRLELQNLAYNSDCSIRVFMSFSSINPLYSYWLMTIYWPYSSVTCVCSHA